jgi:hypothetical protein
MIASIVRLGASCKNGSARNGERPRGGRLAARCVGADRHAGNTPPIRLSGHSPVLTR